MTHSPDHAERAAIVAAIIASPPHRTSVSLAFIIDAVRAGDTHRWTGAIHDHLRNYAAVRAALNDEGKGVGE